jgi:hypothetical protein
MAATFSGSYRKAMTSGTIAAGLTAASYVYAFKFAKTSSDGYAAVRRITVSAGDLLGFTAGFINLQSFITRPYATIEATGGTAGTFTINNGKLDSRDPVSAGAACYIATIAAISGGVGTDDTDPFSNCALSVAATAGAPPLAAPFELFRAMPGEKPLILRASGEGFRIQATVPATGTWQLGVVVDWDEFV